MISRARPLVAGVVVLLGCGHSRTWLDAAALDDVVPKEQQKQDLAALPCAQLCKTDQEFESINSCRLATLAIEPKIVCEIHDGSEGHGTIDQVIAFPAGLDPESRGPIDLKWCPQAMCAPPLAKRLRFDAAAFTVRGCRVLERSPRFAGNERFVICSYRTKSTSHFGP